MATLVVAFALGCILGFAAHRASVCTVRAVAEVMSARSATMFAGVGRTWLWIWAVAFPFLWLVPAAASVNGWPLTAFAVLGGLAFGLGAALNGACAYSTMARFADGEGAMLVAIIGFAAGAGLFALLAAGGWLTRPKPAPALLGAVTAWSLLLAVGFGAWAVFEAIRLWRTRDRAAGWRGLVLAKRYRVSTAAMLIGLSGAVLVLLVGPLGYTSTFEVIIERLLGTGAAPPSTTRWVLLTAVLAGMLISTLQRGSFRLDLHPRRAWLLNFGGGVLMGFGAALAPGGNDALVMYGVPSLSPYALPTYAALIAGVAGGLLLLRAVAGLQPKVEFRNDVFIADNWTRPLPGEVTPTERRA